MNSPRDHEPLLNQARAAARLFLWAGPRALTSVLVGAHQDRDVKVPRLHRGGRALGEAALDEYLIALEALRRTIPDLEHVTRQTAAAARVAERLQGVSADDLYPRPGIMRIAGSRSRTWRSLPLQEVEFSSASARRHPLANDVPWPESPTSLMRVLRHPEPRPWVVWVHGAGMGGVGDLFVFRARALHERLGLNLVFPVLPAHGGGRHGDTFPTIDPLQNLANSLRGVRDVRAVIRWARSQTTDGDLSVVGTSLGGVIAGLAAGLEPEVDRVALLVPMLRMHETIASHLERAGGRGQEVAALLREPAAKCFDQLLHPLAVAAPAEPSQRLLIGAVNDRLTPAAAVAELGTAWQAPVHWHHGSHIGHLLSPDVRTRVDAFLSGAAEADERPGDVTTRATTVS